MRFLLIFDLMKGARILLACIMLLAIVFRSLPNSVFDHFHQHEHAFNNTNDQPTVGNYKHTCHIEDWNFEAFETNENHYSNYQLSSTSTLMLPCFNTCTLAIIKGIGRAPPVALTI